MWFSCFIFAHFLCVCFIFFKSFSSMFVFWQFDFILHLFFPWFILIAGSFFFLSFVLYIIVHREGILFFAISLDCWNCRKITVQGIDWPLINFFADMETVEPLTGAARKRLAVYLCLAVEIIFT